MLPARAGWVILVLVAAAVVGVAVASHASGPGRHADALARPGQPDPISAGEVQTVLEPDAIRAIDDPHFMSVAQATWVPAETPVIGVAIGDQAHAYPTAFLSRHEIVNDVIAGEPAAVTW